MYEGYRNIVDTTEGNLNRQLAYGERFNLVTHRIDEPLLRQQWNDIISGGLSTTETYLQSSLDADICVKRIGSDGRVRYQFY